MCTYSKSARRGHYSDEAAGWMTLKLCLIPGRSKRVLGFENFTWFYSVSTGDMKLNTDPSVLSVNLNLNFTIMSAVSTNQNGQCCPFLGEFEKLRKATVSYVMSVCLSAWNNLLPTERIFVKLNI
jgi:hypothetical protein